MVGGQEVAAEIRTMVPCFYLTLEERLWPIRLCLVNTWKISIMGYSGLSILPSAQVNLKSWTFSKADKRKHKGRFTFDNRLDMPLRSVMLKMMTPMVRRMTCGLYGVGGAGESIREGRALSPRLLWNVLMMHLAEFVTSDRTGFTPARADARQEPVHEFQLPAIQKTEIKANFHPVKSLTCAQPSSSSLFLQITETIYNTVSSGCHLEQYSPLYRPHYDAQCERKRTI